jgi:hypothetical protein
MFSHVTLLVSGNMDALGTMLSIVESYLLLDAKRVLAVSRAPSVFRDQVI